MKSINSSFDFDSFNDSMIRSILEETILTDEESLNQLIYANVSFILAWLILFFSLLSIVSNLLSAIVYSQACMRSPISVLLTGLSGIDALLGALWIPAFVIPCFYVYYRSPTLKSIMSYSNVYVYPFTLMAHCASAWTFVLISIERMIAVCRPFRARWRSSRRSVCALVIVIAASALYNFVRFFEFRILHNEDDPDAPVETEPALRDAVQHPIYMALYYNGLFFVVHFLIPFSALTIVNGLMIGSIYRASTQRRLLSGREKRENRTAIMMAMTVLIFLLCNTLQLILNAVEMTNPNFFTDLSTIVLAFTLNDVCNLLIVFNTSCTAFIYYFFCQKYRRVISRLYARFFACTPECRRGGETASYAVILDTDGKLGCKRAKALRMTNRNEEAYLKRFSSLRETTDQSRRQSARILKARLKRTNTYSDAHSLIVQPRRLHSVQLNGQTPRRRGAWYCEPDRISSPV